MSGYYNSTQTNGVNQPIVQKQNIEVSFLKAVFSWPFLLYSFLLIIFSFYFGMAMQTMWDITTFLLFFVIESIIFVITFLLIHFLIRPHYLNIQGFFIKSFLTLFIIVVVFNIFGNIYQWTHDWISYKKADETMNQDFKKWIPEVTSNITITSRALTSNESFQGANLFFKSVIDGKEKFYSYVGGDIKEVDSISGNKPSVSSNNNAIASVDNNIILISNSELKKMFTITFNNFPDKSSVSGSDFSDDAHFYKAIISFTKGQTMFGKRNVYLEKKLYILFDLDKSSYQISEEDNLPASTRKGKTTKPENLSIDYYQAQNEKCLSFGVFPPSNLFGYLVDKYYNVGSGEEKSVTTFDPERQSIYFVAIKKIEEQSAIIKMDRQNCDVTKILPKDNEIIDGLIRSIYFADSNTIIFSVNTKGKDILEVYSYNLSNQDLVKEISIDNTKIFELII